MQIITTNPTTRRYLGEVLRHCGAGLALLVALQTLLGVAGIANALLLREIIDCAVAGSRIGFTTAVTAFALLLVGQIAMRALTRYTEERCRATLENRLKQRTFATLLARDYAAVAAVHSGEWMNRLTSDTVVIANGLTEILPGSTGMAVRLVGALAILLWLEPRFWLVLLPGLLLAAGAGVVLRRRMKERHKAVQAQDGVLRTYLQEALGSMQVVRAYGVEPAVEAEAATRMQAHKAQRMRKNQLSNLCNSGFAALMNGAFWLGTAICGIGILEGTASYGTLMAVLQLVGQLQLPFASLSGWLPRYYAVLASAERLLEAEQLPMHSAAPRRPLAEVLRRYDHEIEAFGLEQVRFAYQPPLGDAPGLPMPEVLTGFTLHIQAGEYVAFTGRSGCGKSTVLKLLAGLYKPDAGQRYFICAGQRVPLDDSWQKLFAYVPQGNHLISGRIRDVVALAEPEAGGDEARLHRALDIACAGFVYELEQGPDTVLGERGAGLSEGQLQRLALARAVFSAHPVLLLDEATSALDEATERQVLANLRTMTDKTVLIVTHRPAALDICDRVVRF